MNQNIYTPGQMRILKQAATIMESAMKTYDVTLRNPDNTRDYLRNKLHAYEHEVFAALWLNNRHQVIDFQVMFQGTVDGAAVYPVKW